MSLKSTLIALYLMLAMAVFACGSDDTTDVATSEGDNQSQTDGGTTNGDTVDENTAEGDTSGVDGAPIPVEPDGGIGDGAEPLPGAEDPEETGTWHGAQVAETNCPGMEWERVEASNFSFSVPGDFTEADVQPIDSEVGQWTGGNNIEIVYDYGWYSGSIADTPGAENEAVDYSGIVGEQTIVRADAETQVSVFFGEVEVVDGQADRLSMFVRIADPNDEIIGRCIVGSIEWNL